MAGQCTMMESVPVVYARFVRALGIIMGEYGHCSVSSKRHGQAWWGDTVLDATTDLGVLGWSDSATHLPCRGHALISPGCLSLGPIGGMALRELPLPGESDQWGVSDSPKIPGPRPLVHFEFPANGSSDQPSVRLRVCSVQPSIDSDGRCPSGFIRPATDTLASLHLDPHSLRMQACSRCYRLVRLPNQPSTLAIYRCRPAESTRIHTMGAARAAIIIVTEGP